MASQNFTAYMAPQHEATNKTFNSLKNAINLRARDKRGHKRGPPIFLPCTPAFFRVSRCLFLRARQHWPSSRSWTGFLGRLVYQKKRL